jgi:hypothetical protein
MSSVPANFPGILLEGPGILLEGPGILLEGPGILLKGPDEIDVGPDERSLQRIKPMPVVYIALDLTSETSCSCDIGRLSGCNKRPG